MNAAGELIGSRGKKNVAIYFGMPIDDNLEENVKLTMIATGLKEKDMFGAFGGRIKSFIPWK